MIALGAVLAVVAATINALLTNAPGDGWFMYGPGSNQIFDSDSSGRGALLRASGVWLAAVGLWLAVGWRVFRGPTSDGPDASADQ